MEALKLGIGCGDLSREEGIAMFATLFEETLADPEKYFWASLVIKLLDLYPKELIAEIRDLFAKGFVFEGEVSLNDVENEIARGYEVAMENLKKRLEWSLPDDVHKYISWFACFREDKEKRTGHPQNEPSPLKAKRKQKNVNRDKQKQAKAAKRKNRK
jgi:hypothetical protein